MPASATPTFSAAPQQVPATERRSLAPAIVVSLVLHVIVMALAMTTLRGCSKGMPGQAGGDVYRDVGLFVVPGTDPRPNTSTADSDGSDTGDAADNADPAETPPNDVQSIRDALPQEAPSLSELLGHSETETTPSTGTFNSVLPSVIGPGAPLSGLPPRPVQGGSLTSPSGTNGQMAAGAAIPGPGQTAFMNIVDGGSNFVYLIDSSSSMGVGNRLKLAIEQLKASLRLLQPNQNFQVIFYNEKPRPIALRPQLEMYAASEVNVINACREADRTPSLLGTKHLPALLSALSRKPTPDVLYFLTDGDQPQLYPDELQIVIRTAGDTTIHVVEFAEPGLRNPASNWLQQLASRTGGEYRRYSLDE